MIPFFCTMMHITTELVTSKGTQLVTMWVIFLSMIQIIQIPN